MLFSIILKVKKKAEKNSKRILIFICQTVNLSQIERV
jgi:hypothetical protein